MVNVLITSASRKVSLVKAFQKALLQEGGGRVIAVDASRQSAALYFADKYYVSPSGLDNDFWEFIQLICSTEDIHLIVPTRDEELAFFADKRVALESKGIPVMIADLCTIDTCQDKLKFINFCRYRPSFIIPRVLDLAEIARFPVFVKNRRGKGSITAFRCANLGELHRRLDQLDFPIIQEYIDAEEYTVDLYITLSGKVISAIPRLRISTFGGESFVGRTSMHWPIINESIRLGVALELRGHNTIQCFDHDGIIKFIEVNPRFGGGANLGFEAGALTPRYLIREIMGEEVNPQIGNFTEGLEMLRYTADHFVMEQQHVKYYN